jgi:hypothetical protein
MPSEAKSDHPFIKTVRFLMMDSQVTSSRVMRLAGNLFAPLPAWRGGEERGHPLLTTPSRQFDSRGSANHCQPASGGAGPVIGPRSTLDRGTQRGDFCLHKVPGRVPGTHHCHQAFPHGLIARNTRHAMA